jgi:O-antigen biosynthesis protein
MSDTPTVTVAVCVRNGQASIGNCLESLLRLNYPPEKLEIVVVDNASSDKTAEIVSKYPAKVVFERTPGRSSARNTAWKTASHDLVAYTDADCVVDARWLTDIVNVFDDEDVGVAGGRIITPGTDPLARFYEKRRIVSNEEFSGNYRFSPPFLATANAIFRRTALEKCHGFNTEYHAAEDADICWRIQDLGYSVRYVHAGVVFHNHRTTSGGLFRQSIEYGFYGILVYYRHLHRFGSKRWIWWGLYARTAAAVLSLLSIPFRNEAHDRMFPWFDTVRYAGIIIGRLKAAMTLRILVL